MAWIVVWLVALSFWHFGGHWSSFAHFTRYLGCDGFIRAFGGSAAWSVVSSGLAPGGGWFRLFFPLLGLGWLWFPRLLLGCGLLAAVCCGGSFLLPSAHALSTWGQFMDKVMMMTAAQVTLIHVLILTLER